MGNYYIYAGLSDKFGGPDYIETKYDVEFSEALNFAYEQACEVFNNSIGTKGILRIDSFREIAKDELMEEDYVNLEAYKEAIEDYTQELFVDYMEDCISYSAEEEDEDDDDLEYYDDDEIDDDDDDEDDDD
jgi:isopentenyldiphosphate isomerase